MELISKTEQIKQALTKEDYKGAFAIAAKFFTGLTADQKKDIEIAHQSNQPSKKAFYTQLDINTDECTERAKQFLINKFLK